MNAIASVPDRVPFRVSYSIPTEHFPGYPDWTARLSMYRPSRDRRTIVEQLGFVESSLMILFGIIRYDGVISRFAIKQNPSSSSVNSVLVLYSDKSNNQIQQSNLNSLRTNSAIYVYLYVILLTLVRYRAWLLFSHWWLINLITAHVSITSTW